jgi:hypothetical protein
MEPTKAAMIGDAGAQRAERGLQLVGRDGRNRGNTGGQQRGQGDQPATARHRVDASCQQRGGHQESDDFRRGQHEAL